MVVINQLSAFSLRGCAAKLLRSWEMVLPVAKAVAGTDVYTSPSIPSEQITPLGDREGHMIWRGQHKIYPGPVLSTVRSMGKGCGPGSQLL